MKYSGKNILNIAECINLYKVYKIQDFSSVRSKTVHCDIFCFLLPNKVCCLKLIKPSAVS